MVASQLEVKLAKSFPMALLASNHTHEAVGSSPIYLPGTPTREHGDSSTIFLGGYFLSAVIALFLKTLRIHIHVLTYR